MKSFSRALMLGGVIAGGCDHYYAINSDLANPAARTTPGGPTEDGRGSLFHDFGIVRPGQKVTHRFAIRNDGREPWTFQRFHSNCSCTVGNASAAVVPPGGSEYVEVTYNAPTTLGDERRKVGVQFAEQGAPFLWLEIGARVRDEISVMPGRVVLRTRAKDGITEGFFEVHNYGDRDIELASIRISETWVTEVSRARLASDGGGSRPGREPRQVWRVRLRADARGLGPGHHTATIGVVASGSDSEVKPLVVELTIPPLLEPIPSQLFLGTVRRGEPARGKVLLRLNPELRVSSADGLSVRGELPGMLKLDCRSLSDPSLWEISAVLTPDSSARKSIRGFIEVGLADESSPTVRIPVMAQVDEP